MTIRKPVKTKRAQRQEIDDSASIPAPIGGLNTRDPESSMKAVFAQQMENFWPTAKAVTLRRGARDWMTGFADPVKTLMPYRSGTKQELFAVTDDGVFDATAGGVAGAIVSPLTEGFVIYTNFNNSGGSFLIVVNGVDDMRHYNGTTWTTVAAFTDDPVDTKDLIYVNAFKSSLFFLRKDSLDFYYLDAEAIQGDAHKFPLGSKFSKGGKLIAMGNWTVDGGAGIDDYACFVTDAGQVAVYRGSNPSDAADWALIGVFDVGEPVGRRPLLKQSGDLLLLTDGGLLSMAKCLQSSKISLESLVTDLIQPTFQEATRLYSKVPGWQLLANPNLAMLIVNAPETALVQAHQYVMNMTTGAWTIFTGWHATCWELLGQTLYFGVGNRVAKAWQLGGDFGAYITATVKQAWIYLPNRARYKQVRLIRPNIRIGGHIAVNTALDVDFQSSDFFPTPIFTGQANSRFDVDAYDSARWGTTPVMQRHWQSVSNDAAYCTAVRLRAIGTDATFEWSATDYAYETGAIQG